MTIPSTFDPTIRLPILEAELRYAVAAAHEIAAEITTGRLADRPACQCGATKLRQLAVRMQAAVDAAGRLEISERERVVPPSRPLVKSRPEININVVAADDVCCTLAAGPGRTERCECCGVSALARDLVYDATGWRCRSTGACTDRVLAAANVGEAI